MGNTTLHKQNLPTLLNSVSDQIPLLVKERAEKRRGKAEEARCQLSIFMFVATSDDICRLTFLNLESWTCFCGQDAKSLRIKTSLLAVNLISCVIGTVLFFHHNKYCMSGGRLLSD